MVKIATSTWISWMAGMVVTLVTLTAFAFTTFRTETKAKEFESRVEKKLDQIDNKIDLIKEKLYEQRSK